MLTSTVHLNTVVLDIWEKMVCNKGAKAPGMYRRMFKTMLPPCFHEKKAREREREQRVGRVSCMKME